MLPTFENNWDRIELLFSNEFFRSVLREDEHQNENCYNFDQRLSKMEVAIIGLLWCKGDNDEKSEYLFNLAKMARKPGHSNIGSVTSVSTNKT